MPCNLLEHVVEETDAGRNRRIAGRVEVDDGLNTRLVGIACDAGRAVCTAEEVHELRPGKDVRIAAIDEQSTHADTVGQLHIGRAIADHRRRFEVDIVACEKSREQASTWLAAFAVVIG